MRYWQASTTISRLPSSISQHHAMMERRYQQCSGPTTACRQLTSARCWTSRPRATAFVTPLAITLSVRLARATWCCSVFSGHGSQAPTVEPAVEPDQLDETVVPHDGCMPGIYPVRDKEMGTWVAEVGRRGVTNVTVVPSSKKQEKIP